MNDEMRARLEQLRAESRDLQTRFDQRRVEETRDGKESRDPSYVSWKHDITRKLGTMGDAIARLKRGLQPEDKNPPPQQLRDEHRRLIAMLGSCHHLLKRLRADGAVLSPEDERVMDEVARTVGVDPSQLLDDARAMTKLNILHFFHLGAFVAMASRDERDLERMRVEWEKILSTKPLDQHVIEHAGPTYAKALAHLGQKQEAMAVARALPPTSLNAAFAWLSIGEATNDPLIFPHARELGQQTSEPRAALFFAFLYEQTGEPHDAQLAMTTPFADVKREARRDFVVIRGHLHHGRMEDARRVLRGMRDFETGVEALACLANESGDERDIITLTAMMEHYRPTKILTVKMLAMTLASHPSVTRFLAWMESAPWFMQVAGYSVLARFSEDLCEEMISRAMNILDANLQDNRSDYDQALFSLSHVLAMNGRIREAYSLIERMKANDTHCHALLVLYAISRDEPVPPFLDEML